MPGRKLIQHAERRGPCRIVKEDIGAISETSAMTHETDHEPADLYEPFRQFSFPWLGIFGHVHPYPNFIVFSIPFGLGIFMSGWILIRSIAENLALLGLIPLFLIGWSGVGAYGLYTAFVRAAWMRRYERITGAKPVFGDPANKPPDFDDRGWFARRFLR